VSGLGFSPNTTTNICEQTLSTIVTGSTARSPLRDITENALRIKLNEVIATHNVNADRVNTRSKNTTAAYARKQKEYLDWVKAEGYEDDIVMEDRVIVFLKACVIGREYRTTRKLPKSRKRKRGLESIREEDGSSADQNHDINSDEIDTVAEQRIEEYLRDNDAEAERLAEVAAGIRAAESLRDNDSVTERLAVVAVGIGEAESLRDNDVETEQLAEIPAGIGEAEVVNKIVGIQTVNQYVSALGDLYIQQKNTFPGDPAKFPAHPHGDKLKSLIKSLKRQTASLKKRNYADRSAGTLGEMVDSTETSMMMDQYSKHPKHEYGLRHRLDLAFSIAFMSRGSIQRGLSLADIGCISYPNEGIAGATILCVRFDAYKMNQFGNVENNGCMRYPSLHVISFILCRHKDVLICPVSALAQYLFFRFQFNNEAWPVMSRPQQWYDIALIKGKSPTEAITYSQQLEGINNCLRSCGITSNLKTKIGRVLGSNMADASGADESHTRRHGSWKSGGALDNSYLSRGLPMQSVRSLAGFDVGNGFYYLHRAQIEPPDELCRKVFPWIEESEKQLRDGVTESSGPQVVKVMKWLRKVLLQDAAVIKGGESVHCKHRIWSHSVFQDSLFEEFASELKSSIEGASDPMQALIARAVPHVAAALQANTTAQVQHTNIVNSKIDKMTSRLDEIGQSIFDIERQNSSSSITQVSSHIYISINVIGYWKSVSICRYGVGTKWISCFFFVGGTGRSLIIPTSTNIDRQRSYINAYCDSKSLLDYC
jgi:hypothetical protein